MADSTKKVVGKLNVISLRKQTPTVHLISVNGALLPNTIDLKNVLTKVYKSAAVDWEVKTMEGIEVDFGTDGFVHGDISTFATYNPDHEEAIDALIERETNLNEDDYYLFFVEQAKDKKTEVAGFMPQSCHYGFIYDLPNNKTIAHELGHGAFTLEHPFVEFKGQIKEGHTCNLMDYSSCEPVLNKYQWQLIQDPKSIWFTSMLSQEESEAKVFININEMDKKLIFDFPDIEKRYVFIAPSLKPFKIPDAKNIYFNSNGTVNSFEVGDEKYTALYGNRFYGYYNKTSLNGKKDGISINDIQESHIYNKFSEVNKADTVFTYIDKSSYGINCQKVLLYINDKDYNYKNLKGEVKDPNFPDGIVKETIGDCDALELPKNLKEGVGKHLYFSLVSTAKSKDKLIELANYLTDTIGDKKFALKGALDEKGNDYSTIDDNVVHYLKFYDIEDLERFKEVFPYRPKQSFGCPSDCGIIFSDVDLLNGIKPEYNLSSIDWAYLNGTGKKKSYAYTFSDLVIREKFINHDNVFRDAININESYGIALPFSQSQITKQYKSKFHTTSAIFAWAEGMAVASKDVAIAYTLLYAAPAIISNLGAEALIDFLIKKYGKEKAKQFLEGAVVDIIATLISHELFYEKTDNIKIGDLIYSAVMAGLNNTIYSKNIIIEGLVGCMGGFKPSTFQKTLNNPKNTDALINSFLECGISGLLEVVFKNKKELLNHLTPFIRTLSKKSFKLTKQSFIKIFKLAIKYKENIAFINLFLQNGTDNLDDVIKRIELVENIASSATIKIENAEKSLTEFFTNKIPNAIYKFKKIDSKLLYTKEVMESNEKKIVKVTMITLNGKIVESTIKIEGVEQIKDYIDEKIKKNKN
jgi:hypothetical protein